MEIRIGDTSKHGMNCPALGRDEPTPGVDDCNCGLYYRRAWETEQAMHNAWRKRAEEAEALLSRD